MFVLGMRIWAKDKMVYPQKFSVMLDDKKTKSSIRTYMGNDKYESYDFMMLSSGRAINGEIYEKDIIMFEGNEDKMGVVEYSPEHGGFICKLENEIINITNNLPMCEIVGTVYENKEFLEFCKGYTYIPEETEEDIEESKEEVKAEPIKKEEIKEEPVKEEIKAEEFVKENNFVENTETTAKKKKKKKKKKQGNIDTSITSDERTEETKEEINIETVKQEEVKEKTIVEERQEENIESTPESESRDEIVEVYGGDGYTVEYSEPFIDIEETTPIEDVTEPVIEKEVVEEEVIEEVIDVIMNKSKTSKKIELFVSSNCLENGNAGYCFSFKMNDIVDTYKGSETNTSAKRIELISLISALSMLEGKFNITIYCDSQYVIYPFIKGWIHKWKSNDWWKNENDKVQNDDLWNELYELSEKYEIKWNFIKDISNVEEMSECNNIACEEAYNL